MAFDNFKKIVTQVLQLTYNGGITFGDGSSQTVATGYNLIEQKSFSGSDLAFTTIPSTYKELVMIVNTTTVGTFSGALNATFNAGANGSWSQLVIGSATITTQAGAANYPMAATLAVGQTFLRITGYNTANPKVQINGAGGLVYGTVTAAISDITLKAGTSWGTSVGTATLYGIN